MNISIPAYMFFQLIVAREANRIPWEWYSKGAIVCECGQQKPEQSKKKQRRTLVFHFSLEERGKFFVLSGFFYIFATIYAYTLLESNLTTSQHHGTSFQLHH